MRDRSLLIRSMYEKHGGAGELCDLGPHCVLQSSREAVTAALPLRLRTSPQGERVRKAPPAAPGATPPVPVARGLALGPKPGPQVSAEPAAQPSPSERPVSTPRDPAALPFSERSAPSPPLSTLCR